MPSLLLNCFSNGLTGANGELARSTELRGILKLPNHNREQLPPGFDQRILEEVLLNTVKIYV